MFSFLKKDTTREYRSPGIALPSKAHILQMLNGEVSPVIPYQWINWWAYQKGSEHRIYSHKDYNNPFYRWAWHNKEEILRQIYEMLGGRIERDTIFKELLAKKVKKIKPVVEE